jgi:hypothetical protein
MTKLECKINCQLSKIICNKAVFSISYKDLIIITLHIVKKQTNLISLRDMVNGNNNDFEARTIMHIGLFWTFNKMVNYIKGELI